MIRRGFLGIPGRPRDVEDVGHKHGIALVLLFGSLAAGNARGDSDIDVNDHLIRVTQ